MQAQNVYQETILQLPGVVLALGGVGKILLSCLGETWWMGGQGKELCLALNSIFPTELEWSWKQFAERQ